MDLYAHIHEIKQLATQPHLYPLFWDEDISNGLTLVNLISLASHENTDIAAMDTASIYIYIIIELLLKRLFMFY